MLLAALAGVFFALLVDLLQRRSPDHNQRGGSAEAPVGLELEMETLALLFHSLWILQCNTVSADSIIHIGKRRSGAAWWGSPLTGSAGRFAAYQVELELVWNSGATRQLIIIPCQNLGGCRLLHSDPGAHSAAWHKYTRKVLRRAISPSLLPPSFPSSWCLFTCMQQQPRGWQPKAARRGCLVGFSLHPSILPLSSSPSFSFSCSPSQRPPSPSCPLIYEPELSVGRE